MELKSFILFVYLALYYSNYLGSIAMTNEIFQRVKASRLRYYILVLMVSSPLQGGMF